MTTYLCKNCGGELIYDRGWGHRIATGCVNPAVDIDTWKRFLQEKKEEATS